MKINNVYFSVDGDDVGKLIEKSLLENNEALIKSVSKDIEKWIYELTEIISKVNGTLVISGGDMILSLIEYSSINDVLRGISKLQKKHDFTCSAATGRTMSEVYFALKLAKSRGKNHFVNLLDKDFQPISESKIIQITE